MTIPVGGGSTSWVFTDNGDGTWTYVIEDASTLAGDQFKILDSDGKWYGCGGDITFGIGTTNGLYSNNDSNVKFAKALSGKVVLTVSNYSVNTWGNSINLYVTDGTSSYTDLYIVYKNGDSWDALDENLKFTTENGTDYVLNDVAITAGATFAIGNSELHFGIDNAVLTPAATLAEASNRTGWSNNSNYGKWASTIERNVNIVATLGSVQSWGRQIDFKVYYVEGTTPTYPTSLYLYPDGKEIRSPLLKVKRAFTLLQVSLSPKSLRSASTPRATIAVLPTAPPPAQMWLSHWATISI